MSLEMGSTPSPSPVAPVQPVRSSAPANSATQPRNGQAASTASSTNATAQAQRDTFAKLLRGQRAGGRSQDGADELSATAPGQRATRPAHGGDEGDAPDDAATAEAGAQPKNEADDAPSPDAATAAAANAPTPWAPTAPAAVGTAAALVRAQHARLEALKTQAGSSGHRPGGAGTERAEAAAGKDAASASATAPGAPGAASAWVGQLEAALAAAAGAEPAASHLVPTVNEAPAGAPDGSLPSLGAVAQPASAPDPAASSPATAARAELPVPPDSPIFPSALGVQLSTWVNEGVSHATLELHPSELGPIEVRIAVSEGRTQIDLSSDVASTRQALAEAMPKLGEQLGDVGLSLAGSHVSDAATFQASADAGGTRGGASPRSFADSGRSGAGRSGANDSTDARLQALGPGRRPAVPTRGLLDLYA